MITVRIIPTMVENGVVGQIQSARDQQAVNNLENESPHRHKDDCRDQFGEDEHDDLLESHRM